MTTATPRSDAELLALVPEALKGTLVERQFWLGTLKGVARVDAYFDAKAEQLRRSAFDPDTVPDLLVPYLASLVGWSADLPAVSSLTVDELRRITGVAVALWKRKGTDDSWRSILLYLGPARALILDWFYLRIVEGTALAFHLIPDPSDAGGNYTIPEQTTDVWCVDPTRSLDLDKLARTLDLFRPANERINLYRALFVEDARNGLAQWTGTDRAFVRFDADRVGLAATTRPHSGVRTVLIASPDAAPDFGASQGYHVFTRLAVTGAGSLWVALQAGDSADDGYEVRITPGDPAGAVELFRWSAGTASAVGLAGPQPTPAIVEGYRYRWSVDVIAVTGGTEIQVRFEAVLVLTVTDTAGGFLFNGRWGAGTGDSDGDGVILDTVLAYLHGTTPRRVGPS